MHKSLFIFGLSFIIFSCGAETTADTEVEQATEKVVEIEVIDSLPDADYETELLFSREASIAEFAQAIVENDIVTASFFIDFPLMRKAPLSAVQNSTEFKNYFPTLFDSTLKVKLQSHLNNPDIIDMSSSNGTVGILNGLIWFNDIGSKIISINYESVAETELRNSSIEYVKNNMHPILREYKHNVFLGRTEEGLFRIDETEKGLRYASWYADETMLDEPDFILWDGFSEKQGTAGGWTTTFSGVDTQYILDEVNMCEDPADCGTFLLIKEEGDIVARLPVTEILDPRDELIPR